MVNVRMLWDMQGSRYDGRPWAGYGKEMLLPAWEAHELVNAGIAEYADDPALDRGYDVLRVPDPDYESYLKRAGAEEYEELEEEPTAFSDSDIGDFDDDFDEVEEVTPQVKRPTAADNKAVWIEWAVSQGADREKAAAKTKIMLMADY